MMFSLFDKFENNVGKGENAGYQKEYTLPNQKILDGSNFKVFAGYKLKFVL